MPCELEDSAELFGELELEVFNSHVPFPAGADQETVLTIAEAYGLQRVCIAFMPPTEFETVDSIKRTCEKLNQAGVFCQRK